MAKKITDKNRFKLKGGKRYDWKKIKEFFIANQDITITNMSKMPNMPSQIAIQKKANAENWTTQKKDYWQDVKDELDDELFVKGVDLMGEQFKIGKMMRNMGVTSLNNLAKKMNLKGTDGEPLIKLTLSQTQSLIGQGLALQRAAAGYDSISIRAERLAEEDFKFMLSILRNRLDMDTYLGILKDLEDGINNPENNHKLN